MNKNRKLISLTAAIFLLLILALLTAPRVELGQVGEGFGYQPYLPTAFGDGAAYE
jgi:hypothetical protein